MTNKKLIYILIFIFAAVLTGKFLLERNNTGENSRSERNFSLGPNSRNAQNVQQNLKNKYCIATHLDYDNLTPDDREEQMDLLEESGAGWTRFDFEALHFIDENGRPDFSHFDPIIEGLKEREIAIVAILPQWGEVKGADYKKVIDTPGKYAKYAGFLAEYLKDTGINFMIEVGNEPNDEGFWPGRNPKVYASYLIAAYDSIKNVDENIKVISGGVVMYNPIDLKNGTFSALKWLKGMYEGGVKQADLSHEGIERLHFDFYGVHMYPGKNSLSRYTKEIEAIKDFIKSKGDDAGIAITEIGWPTGEDDSRENVTDSEQAEQITGKFRELAENSALNTQVLCYYSLVDSGDSEDMEESYGLLDFDLTPKPAFYAIREITR